jgi:uncharacterized iron-regulated membrane protein
MEGAMKALRKNVMVADTVPVMTRFAGYGTAANENRIATATATRPVPAGNIGLLVAAPIVGLAYVLAFPVIGLALMAWMAIRPLVKRWKPLRRFVGNVALFFAAPFVGLAYALAFPFIGIGMLIWKGACVMVKR